ncbi:MAG: hypothetical protein IJ193_09165, partial [Bacilli bacterium]|nr:hypothetical protein [Bacilli bacterium]
MKDNLKPLFLFVGGCLGLLFFTIYFMSIGGYYNQLSSSKVIPEEAMQQFEKDLANGESIVASNYLPKVETYDNFLSRFFIRIGDFISFLF